MVIGARLKLVYAGVGRAHSIEQSVANLDCPLTAQYRALMLSFTFFNRIRRTRIQQQDSGKPFLPPLMMCAGDRQICLWKQTEPLEINDPTYEEASLDAELRLLLRTEFRSVEPPEGAFGKVLLAINSHSSHSTPIKHSSVQTFTGYVHRLIMGPTAARLVPGGVALVLMLALLTPQMIRGEVWGLYHPVGSSISDVASITEPLEGSFGGIELDTGTPPVNMLVSNELGSVYEENSRDEDYIGKGSLKKHTVKPQTSMSEDHIQYKVQKLGLQ